MPCFSALAFQLTLKTPRPDKRQKAFSLTKISKKWQARRDSNPQHPDLESGALTVRATGLHYILIVKPGLAMVTALKGLAMTRITQTISSPCEVYVFCKTGNIS